MSSVSRIVESRIGDLNEKINQRILKKVSCSMMLRFDLRRAEISFWFPFHKHQVGLLQCYIHQGRPNHLITWEIFSFIKKKSQICPHQVRLSHTPRQVHSIRFHVSWCSIHLLYIKVLVRALKSQMQYDFHDLNSFCRQVGDITTFRDIFTTLSSLDILGAFGDFLRPWNIFFCLLASCSLV